MDMVVSRNLKRILGGCCATLVLISGSASAQEGPNDWLMNKPTTNQSAPVEEPEPSQKSAPVEVEAPPSQPPAEERAEPAEESAEPEQAAPTIPATIRVDRPSFANSSNVVGDGVHSIESGVLVTVNKDDPFAFTQTPLLYRVGLNGEFELRLGTTGLNFKDTDAGWADLSPGFKWNFHNSADLSVSLVGSLTVPIGSKTFRPTSVNPSVSLAIDVPVGPKTGLLFNAGANAPGDGVDRVVQPFATAGVAQTLSDKWGVYVEGAVFGPGAPGGITTTAGDVVVTYLVNNDTQLDAAFFKGFSSSGLDWAATLGLSTRF
jgi:hypothetical protein